MWNERVAIPGLALGWVRNQTYTRRRAASAAFQKSAGRHFTMHIRYVACQFLQVQAWTIFNTDVFVAFRKWHGYPHHAADYHTVGNIHDSCIRYCTVLNRTQYVATHRTTSIHDFKVSPPSSVNRSWMLCGRTWVSFSTMSFHSGCIRPWVCTHHRLADSVSKRA